MCHIDRLQSVPIQCQELDHLTEPQLNYLNLSLGATALAIAVDKNRLDIAKALANADGRCDSWHFHF